MKRFSVVCNECLSSNVEIEPKCDSGFWDDGYTVSCNNCENTADDIYDIFPPIIAKEKTDLKIYLAARFSRRHECHALGKFLQSHGHKIVSRWTKPETNHIIPEGISAEAEFIDRQRFATEDCDDVIECDWMINLMDEPRSGGRGGRHVEFGMALALNKKLTIIGPRETVFHCLDKIDHYNTIDEFVEKIKSHN